MSATLIKGTVIRDQIVEEIKAEVDKIKAEHGAVPGLVTILVGEDPASISYVTAKIKTAKNLGFKEIQDSQAETISEDDLLALVEKYNKDDSINGILVQLPLPKGIDDKKVLNAIDPDKDVDGFHIFNVGRLWTGGESLIPCTPWGSLMMLKQTLGDLTGKRAIIVGRSNIVGKPMAALLLAESCTVSIAHSRTVDLAERCREADILVAAVGRPEMIKGDWVKPGAVVIDVGINRIDAGLKEDGSPKTRLVGDVDFAEASKNASAITPVPGGVGPMTIACLLRNTVVAACRQNGIEDPEF